MIRIITNNLGSGDWTIVKLGDRYEDGDELFSGHRVTPLDLQLILQNLGHQCELVEIDDTQLDEGMY